VSLLTDGLKCEFFFLDTSKCCSWTSAREARLQQACCSSAMGEGMCLWPLVLSERCAQGYWLERETMKFDPQNVLSKVKQKHFFPQYFSVTAIFILLATVVRTTLSLVVSSSQSRQPFKAGKMIIRTFCLHINRSKTFKTIQSVFNTNSVQ